MAARTAQGTKALPGKYYTDPAIYRAETERIFCIRWLYVGRLSELEKAGSYFLYEVDAESIIVLRDEADQPRAFYNVCRHRGTRLCSEEKGKFAKSIQCPYHAWTYALNGQLVGAPNMHEVSAFNHDDYPLHAISLAVWEGCLFINLDSDPEPFTQAFAPLINKFSQWRLSEVQSVHQIVYDIAANWKLVFQNYSECYHCPNLHPVLNRLTPYRNSSNDLEEGPFLGGPMDLAQDYQSMTMTGQRCAAPLGEVSGEDLGRVYYYTVFPNMLLSLHSDYILIHRIQPQSAGQTRIVCDWLFHPDAITQPDFDPSSAIEFWNMTNKQDWQVSELSQKGISSRAYIPGPYAELESMLAAWDREYLKLLDMDLML